MVNYWQKRAYAELSTEPGDLAKRGLVFLLAQFFEVPRNGSIEFAINTNGKNVEFQFYDIVSEQNEIFAYLIEDPATVTTFSPITPRNLNRNFPDTATAIPSAASGVTGGTVIASELIGTSKKVGGEASSNKIHTLKSDMVYVMRFVNQQAGDSICHINLGWSEGEPDQYDLVTEGINSSGVT